MRHSHSPPHLPFAKLYGSTSKVVQNEPILFACRTPTENHFSFVEFMHIVSGTRSFSVALTLTLSRARALCHSLSLPITVALMSLRNEQMRLPR